MAVVGGGGGGGSRFDHSVNMKAAKKMSQVLSLRKGISRGL